MPPFEGKEYTHVQDANANNYVLKVLASEVDTVEALR